mgnify:CR=1 FL=1|tara:strand:- start:157 stop:474 length:318 start_codon:yes stop_codon:yes gene_type:complete
MATTKPKQTENDLREEFNALRVQVDSLVQVLKAKGEQKYDKLGKTLESELEHYQEKAEEKLHSAYKTGTDSLNDLEDKIREKPVSSMLIALCAGYVISKILGNDK